MHAKFLYMTKNLEAIRKKLSIKKGLVTVPNLNEFWNRKFCFKIDKEHWSGAIKTTKETRRRVRNYIDIIFISISVQAEKP